jgi:hypothetical protein
MLADGVGCELTEALQRLPSPDRQLQQPEADRVEQAMKKTLVIIGRWRRKVPII